MKIFVWTIIVICLLARGKIVQSTPGTYAADIFIGVCLIALGLVVVL